MKKSLFIIGTLILALKPAYSQDTLTILKEELVEKVVTNNHQVKITEKQTAIARADFRQSNSLYMPSVSLSYTAFTTNNPLMAFGSRLNQEILTPADFDPILLNDPENIESFATEIRVLQPLINLDGAFERNAANIQEEAYYLNAERTKEYLELQASKIYMQLQLAYEAVNVLQRATITAQQAVQMVTDYYDQGMLQRADLLDAKVRLNEVKNQLQYAKSNVQNTSDQVVILTGEEPGTFIYKPSEKAPLNYEIAAFPQNIPGTRKDLLAMEKSVEAYESMLKSFRMKFFPRINAFGSIQLYDDQIFEFDASGYVLGLRMSWNLFDGYKNIAKTSRARLEMEKANIEQEQYTAQQKAELSKTNRMLSDAKKKVHLSEITFEQSAEAHKIRRDRFEQGLEKTTDLLTAETQMFQKELQYRQAIYEYNFTKEYLHFLTRK